jgi:hypothetical protein
MHVGQLWSLLSLTLKGGENFFNDFFVPRNLKKLTFGDFIPNCIFTDGTGVNIMVTIFSDFRYFSVEKINDFYKNHFFASIAVNKSN